MTFAEMKTVTRRKLNEARATFWTDADIAEALNESHAELSDETEFYERWAMIPFLKGRTYYDLSLVLPDVFLSPRRCWNSTTGIWLEPVDTRVMDGHTFAQWELTTGQPEKYWLRGNWWIGVWPKPAVDSKGLKLCFSGIPPDMTDDSDTPLFPQEFHFGIVDGALSDLLAQERETQKAVGYWKSFMGYQDRLKKHVQDRISLARLDVM